MDFTSKSQGFLVVLRLQLMQTTLQEPLLLLMQIKWTLTTEEDMHDTAHGVRLYRGVTWLDACSKDANGYLILFLDQLINSDDILL